MIWQFTELASAGCNFLVAGRVDNGSFRTLADVAVSATLQQLVRVPPMKEGMHRVPGIQRHPCATESSCLR